MSAQRFAVVAAMLLALMLPVALADPENKEQQGFYIWPLWARWVLCVTTIVFSAMFCGLTIGLLGIDTVTLETIAGAGEEPERTYAQKILPIRALGHRLLCTLLLGNMLTLVLSSQLIAALVQSTDLVNFIVGTLVILIFGEIIPMAYCNKGINGLRAGVKSLPALKLSLLVLYPVAKPLGMLLDCTISHDAGQLYDKKELKKLIRVHCEKFADRTGISQDELKMMLSALEMNETTVATVMTPIPQTLMLEASLPVNAALQRQLWQYGKSRIPIYEKTKANIIGILFVKDLISVQILCGEAEGMTLRDFIVNHPRDLLVVSEHALLQDALKIFESHYTQMLFVEQASASSGGMGSGARALDSQALRAKGSSSGGGTTLSPSFGDVGASKLRREGGGDDAEEEAMSRGSPVGGGRRPASATSQPSSARHSRNAKGERNAPATDVVVHAQARSSLAIPVAITPKSLLEEESTARRVFVGVVTLEDIIERLIASEIYDEDDFEDNSDGTFSDTNSDLENEMLLRSVTRSVSLQKQPVKLPRVNFYSYGLSTSAIEQEDDLSEEQKWALASFMTRRYVYFAAWSISKIKFLLDVVGDQRIYVTDEHGSEGGPGHDWGSSTGTVKHAAGVDGGSPLVLYEAGRATRSFTLLLSGGIAVSIHGGNFHTELRSFSSLGEEVFSSSSGFVPDYTAVVTRSSRLIVISHDDIYRVERRINAVRRQRSRRPVKLSTFDQAVVPPPGIVTPVAETSDWARAAEGSHTVRVEVHVEEEETTTLPPVNLATAMNRTNMQTEDLRAGVV